MTFIDEISYDPYELNVDYSILQNIYPKITSLPVGPNPQGLCYSEKYQRIYVANNKSSTERNPKKVSYRVPEID